MSYSQTFVMSNKAREMKAAGINVISLTLGEPDFDVPENVKVRLLRPLTKITATTPLFQDFWNFGRRLQIS